MRCVGNFTLKFDKDFARIDTTVTINAGTKKYMTKENCWYIR